jgi:hypothetical protein
MNTHHHLRTPDFQPNIPLLDMAFDAQSPDVFDFILSHREIHNDQGYAMNFCMTQDN